MIEAKDDSWLGLAPDEVTSLCRLIDRLSATSSKESAAEACLRIEYLAVLDNELAPIAELAVALLIRSLFQCTDLSRCHIMETLVTLCNWDVESVPGLLDSCARELSSAAALYFYLIEVGTDEERFSAVDLLDLCCHADPWLRPRFIWRLGELRLQEISQPLSNLIDDVLRQFDEDE